MQLPGKPQARAPKPRLVPFPSGDRRGVGLQQGCSGQGGRGAAGRSRPLLG